MESKYFPQLLCQKEYNEQGKIVSLMLRICRPVFGTGKAVVLYSGLSVAKDITDIEYKCVYKAVIIKKGMTSRKEFLATLCIITLKIMRLVVLE